MNGLRLSSTVLTAMAWAVDIANDVTISNMTYILDAAISKKIN